MLQFRSASAAAASRTARERLAGEHRDDAGRVRAEPGELAAQHVEHDHVGKAGIEPEREAGLCFSRRDSSSACTAPPRQCVEVGHMPEGVGRGVIEQNRHHLARIAAAAQRRFDGA